MTLEVTEEIGFFDCLKWTIVRQNCNLDRSNKGNITTLEISPAKAWSMVSFVEPIGKLMLALIDANMINPTMSNSVKAAGSMVL